MGEMAQKMYAHVNKWIKEKDNIESLASQVNVHLLFFYGNNISNKHVYTEGLMKYWLIVLPT
jgi:hypothetical protein